MEDEPDCRQIIDKRYRMNINDWLVPLVIWLGGNTLTYYVLRNRGHLAEDWTWTRWVIWPLPLLISIFTPPKAVTVKPDTFQYDPERDDAFLKPVSKVDRQEEQLKRLVEEQKSVYQPSADKDTK
jgi:hypothetical protein